MKSSWPWSERGWLEMAIGKIDKRNSRWTAYGSLIWDPNLLQRCGTRDKRFIAISTRITLQWNAYGRACRHMHHIVNDARVTVIRIRTATVKYGNDVKLHCIAIQWQRRANDNFHCILLKIGSLIWLITGRAQNFNYDISVAHHPSSSNIHQHQWWWNALLALLVAVAHCNKWCSIYPNAN